LFKTLLIVQWGLPWYFTCKYAVFNPSNPSITLPCPFPTLYCLTDFGVFPCVSFLHRCNVFQYYPLPFPSSFPPPSVSSNSLTLETCFIVVCICVCICF
jgi:hypothetical protein